MFRIHRAGRLALMCGASVLSLAAMTVPSLAFAQDAPAPQNTEDDEAVEVEEVVVSGIRAQSRLRPGDQAEFRSVQIVEPHRDYQVNDRRFSVRLLIRY